ncbi:MAG: PKD domain-containing protein [Aeromicrobium sp.]
MSRLLRLGLAAALIAPLLALVQLATPALADDGPYRPPQVPAGSELIPHELHVGTHLRGRVQTTTGREFGQCFTYAYLQFPTAYAADMTTDSSGTRTYMWRNQLTFRNDVYTTEALRQTAWRQPGGTYRPGPYYDVGTPVALPTGEDFVYGFNYPDSTHVGYFDSQDPASECSPASIAAREASTSADSQEVVWTNGPVRGIPVASFTAEVSDTTPRQVTFTSTSTDPDGQPLTLAWTLGDGTTSTAQSFTHTYQRSDRYTVELTATDPDGKKKSVTQVVDVTGLDLSGRFTVVGDPDADSFREGQEADLRMTIDNGTLENLTGVTIDSATIVVDTTAPEADRGAATLTGPTDDGLRGTLTGTGATSSDQADFHLVAEKKGDVQVVARLSGTKPSGTKVTGTITYDVSIKTSPLAVSVTTDPEELVLESTRTEGDTGEIEFETEPGEMVVAVEVANLTDEEISSFTMPPEPTITKLDEYVGATRIGTVAGPCASADTCRRLDDGGTEDVDTVHGPLAAQGEDGDSRTVYYRLEVLKPGRWNLRVGVLSLDPTTGTSATSVGNGPAKATDGIDLVLTVDPPDATPIVSGQPRQVLATLKNRHPDKTFTIGSLFPELTGNVSGGELIPLGTPFEPPGTCCDVPFSGDLGPGESVQLRGQLRTMPENGTRATVEYALTAYDEDRDPVAADHVVTEAGPFTLTVDDSVPPPPDLDYLEAFAGLSAGAGFAVVDFVWGPVQFAAWAAKGVMWDLPKAVISSTAYWIEFWETATEEEKRAWAARVGTYVQSAMDPVTYEKAWEGGTAAVNAWAYTTFDTFITQLNQGRWFEAYQQIGSFAGNVGLEVATSGMFAFAKADDVRQAVKLSDTIRQSKIAQTIIKIPDDIRKLRLGSKLDNLQLRAFGITDEMAEALRRFATENKLVLTFRRRNPDSLRWLDEGALQKPQHLKMKTVNDIDATYLGYPDKGALVLKQPPADIAGILAGIDDPQLAKAVEARWAKRQDEWVEFTSTAKKRKVKAADGSAAKNPDGTSVFEDVLDADGKAMLNDANYFGWDEAGEMPWPGRPNGQKLAFDYEANPVGVDTVPGSNGFKLQERTGTDGQKYWEVLVEDQRMTGTPQADRFKRVTGDLDGLDFRNADGTVLDDAALIKVWEGLNEITGLDHGETVSFVKDKTPMFEFKAQILADHGSPGGDPLIQFGPDGMARNVLLDPTLSVFDTATGSRKHHVWFKGGYVTPRFAAKVLKPVVFKDVLRYAYLIFPVSWLGTLGCATFRYDDGGDGVILRKINGRFESWTQATGWTPAGSAGTCAIAQRSSSSGSIRSQAVAEAPATARRQDAGDVSSLVVRTSSDVTAGALPGATALQIRDLPSAAEQALFPSGSEWFAAGQEVVINPGGATQELAIVAPGAPLMFTQPLRFAHDQGEMVAVTRSAPVATPTPVPAPAPVAAQRTTTRISVASSVRERKKLTITVTVRAGGAAVRAGSVRIVFGGRTTTVRLSSKGTARVRLKAPSIRPRSRVVKVTASYRGSAVHSPSTATSRRVKIKGD